MLENIVAHTLHSRIFLVYSLSCRNSWLLPEDTQVMVSSLCEQETSSHRWSSIPNPQHTYRPHSIAGPDDKRAGYGTELLMMWEASCEVLHKLCWMKPSGGSVAVKGRPVYRRVYHYTNKLGRFLQLSQCRHVWHMGVWRLKPAAGNVHSTWVSSEPPVSQCRTIWMWYRIPVWHEQREGYHIYPYQVKLEPVWCYSILVSSMNSTLVEVWNKCQRMSLMPDCRGAQVGQCRPQ